jgi:hypothetical protein
MKRYLFLVLGPVISVITVFLLLTVSSCSNDTGGQNTPPTPIEGGADQNAIFGYNIDHSYFFTQNVTEKGMGDEIYTGEWKYTYRSMTSFTMADGKQYVFALGTDNSSDSDGYYWFIQEILPTGDLGQETDSDYWEINYRNLSAFTIPGGKTFIYGQTPISCDEGTCHGTYWSIHEINPGGKLGAETDSGTWDEGTGYQTYTSALVINPNTASPVLFCLGHTEFVGYGGGSRWFLRPINKNGTLAKEASDQNTWLYYYDSLASFKVGDTTYLFGQSSDNKHWFIQEVSSTMGKQTDDNTWHYFYDTVAPYSINNRTFLFLQTTSNDNYWNIMEVVTGGIMGSQIGSDGHWGHFFDFVFPISFDTAYLDTEAWMTKNYDLLKDRTLHEIAIPGSHDAGMNGRYHCDCANDCNTQTQIHPIGTQLRKGARYFDIRPTNYIFSETSPDWYAGHYQYVSTADWGYCGCLGERIEDILNDVASFCGFIEPVGAKELIILNFSHCYHIVQQDSGSTECSDDEWATVLNMAVSKLGHWLVDWSKYGNPEKAIFGDRGERQYVLLRFETGAIASDPASGVYNSKDFPIYNDYADKNDFDQMSDDQMDKLTTSANHEDQLFLLSWTLTLSDGQAVKCLGAGSHISILDLAMEADNNLMWSMQDWISGGQIKKSWLPNIIYVDRFETFGTRAAIYVNEKYSKMP